MKISFFLADAQGIPQIFSGYDSSPDININIHVYLMIIGRCGENGAIACFDNFPLCLKLKTLHVTC